MQQWSSSHQRFQWYIKFYWYYNIWIPNYPELSAEVFSKEMKMGIVVHRYIQCAYAMLWNRSSSRLNFTIYGWLHVFYCPIYVTQREDYKKRAEALTRKTTTNTGPSTVSDARGPYVPIDAFERPKKENKILVTRSCFNSWCNIWRYWWSGNLQVSVNTSSGIRTRIISIRSILCCTILVLQKEIPS